MKQMTGNMASVVKGMDKAMESMNLERISLVMDKFETQFSDLDVQTAYMENAVSSTTATSTPQDQVELLMQQIADENKIELQHDLAQGEVDQLPELGTKEKAIGDEDAALAQRLRALRPA